jgi:hypothetical protein
VRIGATRVLDYLGVSDTAVAEHPIVLSYFMALLGRSGGFKIVLESSNNVPSMACCFIQVCALEGVDL